MPKKVFSQSFTKIEWVCVALLEFKILPQLKLEKSSVPSIYIVVLALPHLTDMYVPDILMLHCHKCKIVYNCCNLQPFQMALPKKVAQHILRYKSYNIFRSLVVHFWKSFSQKCRLDFANCTKALPMQWTYRFKVGLRKKKSQMLD